MLNKGVGTQPRGQTLLEVIVAISVLVIISISLAQLTVQALSVQRLVRERTVAIGLAQEGVEWARSIRDSNWLRNDAAVPWDTGLHNGFEYIATLGWDSSQRKFVTNFGTSGSLLYRTTCSPPLPGCQPDAYTTSTVSTTPTIFHRLVYLWPICMDLSGTPTQQAASEETIMLEGAACPSPKTKVGVVVRADVQYRDGRLFTVTAEERLYNWREGAAE